ncbi:multidrug efflux RND transporter permease subunit, partial [Escherichia coli]|nr:multidrug efflux RND transporter permease subunit [Escherichia coli]EJO9114948.1 efflux RND transporter permease subunit [Escherichia coli]
VDNEKATALGVSLGDITNTLSYAWGGSYIGDFIDNGRVKRVYIQGEADSRMQPTDLNKWHVRNDNGEMTPFGSITDTYWSYGPDNLNRFNGTSAYNIQGSASAGYSSGQAMAEMIKLVKELPKGATWSWSDLSYQEQQAGSQGPMLYALSILVVFLCLAALYESWSVPISVITVIPLGVIGAVLAASFRGIENDVYFQVA